jgi:hypothetical protein
MNISRQKATKGSFRYKAAWSMEIDEPGLIAGMRSIIRYGFRRVGKLTSRGGCRFCRGEHWDDIEIWRRSLRL